MDHRDGRQWGMGNDFPFTRWHDNEVKKPLNRRQIRKNIKNAKNFPKMSIMEDNRSPQQKADDDKRRQMHEMMDQADKHMFTNWGLRDK